MKKKGIVSFVLAATLLTACKDNPDAPIVAHKDMDELIEKAQNTEGDIVEVEDMAKEYDSYQTEINDESLHVSVKVDADVDIPEAEKLCVYRVRQMPITQELVDKVINEFMPGETLYDGAVLSVKTKADLENEIAQYQQMIKDSENGENEDKEVMINEWQYLIDELQKEYEQAKDTVNWDEFVTDSKLVPVKEKYDKGINNSLYDWMYSLNENGDVVDVVIKTDDGRTTSFYAQNNERYGNWIKYNKEISRIGSIWSVVGGAYNLDVIEKNTRHTPDIWPADEEMPAEVKTIYGDLNDMTTAPVTGDIADAEKLANDFLAKMGIEDFYFFDGGKYNVIFDDIDGEHEQLGYRTYNILTYMRKMEGVFVNFDGTPKFTYGWNNDQYYKKMWALETIQFLVNDEGISSFEWEAPLEVTETVVDKSAIKSFDEIKNTFEQMVVIKNSVEDVDVQVKIDVDRVVLGYARISEKDSFDTGLLVPVWDFFGTVGIDGDGGNESYESILTINAIDGTVVDRTLGY